MIAALILSVLVLGTVSEAKAQDATGRETTEINPFIPVDVDEWRAERAESADAGETESEDVLEDLERYHNGTNPFVELTLKK